MHLLNQGLLFRIGHLAEHIHQLLFLQGKLHRGLAALGDDHRRGGIPSDEVIHRDAEQLRQKESRQLDE